MSDSMRSWADEIIEYTSIRFNDGKNNIPCIQPGQIYITGVKKELD